MALPARPRRGQGSPARDPSNLALTSSLLASPRFARRAARASPASVASALGTSSGIYSSPSGRRAELDRLVSTSTPSAPSPTLARQRAALAQDVASLSADLDKLQRGSASRDADHAARCVSFAGASPPGSSAGCNAGAPALAGGTAQGGGAADICARDRFVAKFDDAGSVRVPEAGVALTQLLIPLPLTPRYCRSEWHSTLDVSSQARLPGPRTVQHDAHTRLPAPLPLAAQERAALLRYSKELEVKLDAMNKRLAATRILLLLRVRGACTIKSAEAPSMHATPALPLCSPACALGMRRALFAWRTVDSSAQLEASFSLLERERSGLGPGSPAPGAELVREVETLRANNNALLADITN